MLSQPTREKILGRYLCGCGHHCLQLHSHPELRSPRARPFLLLVSVKFGTLLIPKFGVRRALISSEQFKVVTLVRLVSHLDVVILTVSLTLGRVNAPGNSLFGKQTFTSYFVCHVRTCRLSRLLAVGINYCCVLLNRICWCRYVACCCCWFTTSAICNIGISCCCYAVALGGLQIDILQEVSTRFPFPSVLLICLQS